MIQNQLRSIVMRPEFYQTMLEVNRYWDWKNYLLPREAYNFKGKFRPNWHARWLQRRYVRHIEDIAMRAAKAGIEAP